MKETTENNFLEEGISEEMLVLSIQQLVHILGSTDRTYKDRVFRMLVKDRAVALEIYNAMNDTNYRDPTQLQITTLENAIYMGMKNDVSFIIDSRLAFYEHQSTDNPNMPLRNLFYVACVYASLVDGKNIYGSRLISLPNPKFVVFYNGKKDLPERSILRLSDAYEVSSEHEETALELQVEVLNINRGKNQALMEKSPTLYQYSFFVDTVRKYESALPFEQAMEWAIDECIGRGILSDFLQHNKAEVLRVCLFEYDQEKHIRQEKDESWEDCQTAINQLNLRLIADDRIDDLKRSAADTVYQKELLEEYELL